ncbi:MAG: hypothetical protein H6993_14930 [Pseudomonadales bacterium]|nr:hypothetical protein [Pseudomonadales bacterium]
MQIGIRQNLMLFATITVIATVFVGATGYFGQRNQEDSLTDMSAKMQALRFQLEADMMHDAIRGDVLAALYAASTRNTAARSEVEADLAGHVDTFTARIDAISSLPVSSDILAAVTDVKPALLNYAQSAKDIVNSAFTDVADARVRLPAFQDAFSELEDGMEAMSDLIATSAGDSETAARETAQSSQSMMLWIVLAVGIASALYSRFIMRTIMRPLTALHGAIEGVRRDTDATERLQGFNAEFRAIQTAFNGVLDSLAARRDEERKAAEAALRVQEALNKATTNLVLADASNQVIYLNETAKNMFSQASQDIRRSLPGFDVARSVGAPLGQFFPDAATTRAITQCTTSREDEILLGHHTYSVSTTAVQAADGSLLGRVCEWQDLTEQREAERQIADVISAAVNGQLTSRLDASRFRGFMAELAGGVNEMLDAITGPLQIAASNLQAIAEGKIPAPIDQQFRGAFDDIRNNLNTCISVLRAMVEDTAQLAEAAAQGRLSERADSSRHWGDFRSIVDGVNRTLDAVAKPVADIRNVITGFADGDLTRRMATGYQGDFADLRDAVESSLDHLERTIARIGDSAETISNAAAEMSRSNQELNERTQEQAAALEETTSSMQQLAEQAKNNAAHTTSANELALTARTRAEKGGAILEDAISAMNEINHSSKRISDIISVIDGIAFQTNLLALNAAVEAARAGEQGRGFAVVASEVRNLAQSSASAAREISDLIKDSVQKVDQGSVLVNASGDTLREIVTAVKQLGDLIGDMSVNTSAQLTGAQEITTTMRQLDDVTQRNAGQVEQSAASSESMADEAVALRELTTFFRTSVADSKARGKKIVRLNPSSAKSQRTRPANALMQAAGGDGWTEF